MSPDVSRDQVLSGSEAARAVAWPAAHAVAPRAVELSPALEATVAAEVDRRIATLDRTTRDEATRIGLDEGRLAAREELGELLAALDATTRELRDDTRAGLDALAARSVELALEIADAILECRTEHTDAVLVPVQAVLAELADQAEVRLVVHPDDADLVRASASTSVTVVADASVRRGDCRAESSSRLATDGVFERLDRIREAVC